MIVPPDYYDRSLKKNPLQFVWHRRRFQIVKKLLPSSAGCVLDVGCHGGMLTEKIGEAYPQAKITGIDIDHGAIRYACIKRPRFKFEYGEAENLPFPDNKFDLITCFEVLEHIKGVKKGLSEIRRCLKKGGQLVIIVPSENWLFRSVWGLWIRGKGKVWNGTHLHNLGGNYLIQLLEDQGFKIEKRQNSHLGMLLSIVAIKTG